MGAEESRRAIRRELDLVLSSPGFARNDRQSRFLRFLIDRHLDGRDDELKESVVAVEVFGREPGYDPKLDGIVRTEAMRLRARLDKYYADEGSSDPLIIELPKGGYRPVFRVRAAADQRISAPAPPESSPQVRRAGFRWSPWVVFGLTVAVLGLGANWWWGRPIVAPVTIAVLPFENQDPDPASDYFADGLTDETIRNLSAVEGLTVLSRTSSFAVKGKGLDAIAAGKQLGADYLIEGSVLHVGDQLRIIVGLVRVRDGARLWSGRFDRKLTDVFAIQDEISHGIVNNLRLKLGPGRRQYETNVEAYDLYLRGRHTMASFPARGRGLAIRAVQYFEQAIDKDANYAIAYAGIADALIAVDKNMGAAAHPSTFPRAKAAAEKAVHLDSMLSEAHSALASIRAREYAWQEAERGFRRAIQLNASNTLAHLELGVSVLVPQGRFEEGLAEVRRAAALDSLSPYTNTEFGRALLLSGHFEEAADQLAKAIALDSSRSRAYTLRARALYLQGKTTEALAAFDDGNKTGAPIGGPGWLACAEVQAGRQDRALTVLHKKLDGGAPTEDLAQTYACLVDAEQTLEHLEKLFEERHAALPEILQSPELAWLLPNTRFVALRKNLNLAH